MHSCEEEKSEQKPEPNAMGGCGCSPPYPSKLLKQYEE